MPSTLETYKEFFLGSSSHVVELELLEISHPDFTQTYRKVRNARGGVTVTLEDSSVHTFDYAPMLIKQTETRDNLDYGFNITFGDLGEILPTEMDAVAAAGGFNVLPVVTYRAYRSDDLSAPMFGPVELEVQEFTFKEQGATFLAKAPSLNVSKTGESYTLDRFPMLRGFL